MELIRLRFIESAKSANIRDSGWKEELLCSGISQST